MKNSDFTTTLLVDQTPGEVFRTIQNVGGWWSEEVEGNAEKLNDIFYYHYEDIHRCTMKLVEMIPDKKLVWLVTDNYFKPGIFDEAGASLQKSDGFRPGKDEWIGTSIHFEIDAKDGKTQIRFTHQGLVPEFECYDACFNGWTHYITQSLFSLITTGKGQPNKTGRPMTTNEKELHEKA